MALLVKREDARSELQQRVAAELREKIKGDQSLVYEKPINSVEEATHESKDLGAIILFCFLCGYMYIVAKNLCFVNTV